MAERGSGSTFAAWNAKQLNAVKQLASGDVTIQDIGADVQRVALVVKVTAAELSALGGAVLSSGSLVYGYETHDAFLEGIEGVSEILAGQDTYFATLNLVRL
jgi:hypothetical protein